ncbi:hypothetical protein O6H91_15G089300 [Diphasiastrum complanatum]|uniref:Uncharacterized protein n=1 Tax=Diphasiastrum complanatum TaxID=34168 RepID=A0ACC2BKL6_DIPCM|nr:hypothetical protein O6H91_15G089300 [Diphasiastrum complanatum]
MPIASIEGGDLCKVWEIKTLGRDRDAEVRKLLEAVAKQVQPLMRKRKWKVRLLTEFCPSNPSLLGLNIGGGQEIRIRVRRPGWESEFFRFEDLVGTMLHELTHNEHGPHDAKFYKLLDEVTKECEELMAKGISGTGQGFDGQGKRLGGSFIPSLSNQRQLALAAAEKRILSGRLMPAGPRRLGGDNEIMNALSPVQAAAMAAERRLKDDLWCAAPVTMGSDGINKAREKEEVRAAGKSSKGFTKEVGITPSNQKHVDAGGQDIKTNSAGSSSGSFEDPVASSSEVTTIMWECSICTLVNVPHSPICAACGSSRAKEKIHHLQSWMCKRCTLENPSVLDVCAACDQWRYSYGPAASVRGPMKDFVQLAH